MKLFRNSGFFHFRAAFSSLFSEEIFFVLFLYSQSTGEQQKKKRDIPTSNRVAQARVCVSFNVKSASASTGYKKARYKYI